MKNIIRNLVFLLIALMICLNHGCDKPGWVSQSGGTTNLLVGVWFTDANTGTIVGARGTILHTTDGGGTWSNQISGSKSLLRGVCFSNPLNGWVVGSNGTILHTIDGGLTWTQQASGTLYTLYTVFCLDTNMVWAVGHSTILHTIDGGTTWTRQRSGITTVIWDVFFTNSDTGTAVCGGCSDCDIPFYGGYILNTTNGGATWTIQKHDTTILGLYGVYFTNAATGTVVGAGGTILRTTNGGDTWIRQISGTTNNLLDVFFYNADTGTVIGGNYIGQYLGGTILRTTNGGKTWKQQEIPTQVALRNVFFTDANTGTVLQYTGVSQVWVMLRLLRQAKLVVMWIQIR